MVVHNVHNPVDNIPQKFIDKEDWLYKMVLKKMEKNGALELLLGFLGRIQGLQGFYKMVWNVGLNFFVGQNFGAQAPPFCK